MESSSRCPRCGGRLFVARESAGSRSFFVKECVACARQFEMSGSPVQKSADSYWNGVLTDIARGVPQTGQRVRA